MTTAAAAETVLEAWEAATEVLGPSSEGVSGATEADVGELMFISADVEAEEGVPEATPETEAPADNMVSLAHLEASASLDTGSFWRFMVDESIQEVRW